jgi:hypothetical protein
MGRDVTGDHAAPTNHSVMANTDTGQNEHSRANPDMVVDHDRLGRRQYFMLPDVVLVVVNDEAVMT